MISNESEMDVVGEVPIAGFFLNVLFICFICWKAKSQIHRDHTDIRKREPFNLKKANVVFVT